MNIGKQYEKIMMQLINQWEEETNPKKKAALKKLIIKTHTRMGKELAAWGKAMLPKVKK